MKAISAVQEDYLEAILELTRRKGVARARDIAQSLAVHKSTVTAALRALAGKGLLAYSPYEYASLTPGGMALAQRVSDQHGRLRSFLANVLLMDEKTAETNACRMEHAMDPDVVERLTRLSDFLAREKRVGRDTTRRLCVALRRKRPGRVPS
jgi:DtxR family Mn-dependent transcriptional regulator